MHLFLSPNIFVDMSSTKSFLVVDFNIFFDFLSFLGLFPLLLFDTSEELNHRLLFSSNRAIASEKNYIIELKL